MKFPGFADYRAIIGKQKIHKKIEFWSTKALSLYAKFSNFS